MSIYILMWPVISAVVLYVIVSAFLKEWRQAKRDGNTLI